MKLLTLASLIVLAGCATADKLYLPDGSQGYAISCDGGVLSMNTCFRKASDLCGAHGYTVYNREGEAIPFGYSGGQASYGEAGYTTTTGVMVNRDLMVKCGQ